MPRARAEPENVLRHCTIPDSAFARLTILVPGSFALSLSKCRELIAISVPSGENATESVPPFASIETVRTFVKVVPFQTITPVPVSASLRQLPALANKLPSGEKATAFASPCPIKSCLSVSVFTFQIFSRPGPVLRSSSRSEARKTREKSPNEPPHVASMLPSGENSSDATLPIARSSAVQFSGVSLSASFPA